MGVPSIRAAVLLAALPAAGCGTAANLIRPGPDGGGKAPFGGVRQDVRCIEQATAGGEGRPAADPEPYPRVVLALCCAADLPFSLVGDLVTWPYTVAFTCINQPVPAPPVEIVSPPPRQGAGRPQADRPAGPTPLPIPVPPGQQPRPTSGGRRA